MARDIHNSLHVRRGISPAAAVVDNTPFVSQIADLLGYEAAEFVILTGALSPGTELLLQGHTARYHTRPISGRSVLTVMISRSTARWRLAGPPQPTMIRLVMLLLEKGHCHQHSLAKQRRGSWISEALAFEYAWRVNGRTMVEVRAA